MEVTARCPNANSGSTLEKEMAIVEFVIFREKAYESLAREKLLGLTTLG